MLKIKGLEEKTNADLLVICAAHHIEVPKKANKATIIECIKKVPFYKRLFW